MKYLVKVLNVPVRYDGQRYLPGDEFEMKENHLNESLIKVIGEAIPLTFNEMKVPELKEYAAEHGIALGDAKKRDEILKVIQKFEEANKTDDNNLPDGEGEQSPPSE